MPRGRPKEQKRVRLHATVLPETHQAIDSEVGKPAPIPFENNKGEKLILSGDLTIKQLVKMGVRGIRIVKPDAPIPDGWWRDCGEQKKPNTPGKVIDSKFAK